MVQAYALARVSKFDFRGHEEARLMILRWIMVVIFVVILTTCTASLYSRPVKRHYEAGGCREQAMNDTLLLTLIVGAEFREKGRHPTWAEIQSEVIRRMHLLRK